jgi:hypothetical protein
VAMGLDGGIPAVMRRIAAKVQVRDADDQAEERGGGLLAESDLYVSEYMDYLKPLNQKTIIDRTGVPYHQDGVCYPGNGVAVGFLYASDPANTTRAVMFRPHERAKGMEGLKSEGFVMKPGSLYVMGEQVFDKQVSLYQHMSTASMRAGGKCIVVLFRFGPKRVE